MSQSKNETKKSTIKVTNSNVVTHMTSNGDYMEIDDDDLCLEELIIQDDPTPKHETPVVLKYREVYTLDEEFDREGLCQAITMLKYDLENFSVKQERLLPISKQPSDKTMPEQRTKTWLRKLETLRDSIQYTRNQITVTYRRPMLPIHICKKGESFGRATAVGLSSQTMPRKIRALLFGQLYQDVDCVNAHPTICVSLYPNRTPQLTKYVVNRKDWLKEVMDIHLVARDDAKTLFLTPLNSEKPVNFYKNWCKEQLDNDGTVIRKKLTEHQGLKKKYSKLAVEIVNLRRIVLADHPEFLFNTNKKNRKKTKNKKQEKKDHVGTYFNKWLCSEEAKAIQVVKTELEKQGFGVHSVIHDGCHKYGKEDANIQKINEALQKTWPMLEVKIKEFDMPEFPSNLQIEYRHAFNSCTPASQTKIVSLEEIYAALRRAAGVVYECEQDMWSAVDNVISKYMNKAVASLSENKPIVVQRLFGDFVVQNSVHNDGTSKIKAARLRQRKIDFKEVEFKKAKEMWNRYLSHSFKWNEYDAEGTAYLKKKTVHTLNRWYNDINANNYTKSVFNPNIDWIPSDHLNRYHGFAVEPSQLSFEECKKICEPWLDHIHKVWANGYDDHFDYIMAWLAHTVQCPWLKIGIAMVVLGEKRCGKGIIISKVLEIFGQHASEITQGEQATGNFNAALMDKVFISMNEASWGGNNKGLGVMRGLITDPSFQGTRKFKDSKPCKNFLDFIFSSNFMHVVCNKNGEQRYYIFRCSPKYSASSKTVSAKEKKDHMDAIANVPVSVVLKLLLNWQKPVSIDLKNPPYTEEQQEQTEHSMTTVQQYILACMRGNWPKNCVVTCGNCPGYDGSVYSREDRSIWGQYVDKERFYEGYRKMFARGTANTTPVNSTVFWKNVRGRPAEYACNLKLGPNNKNKVAELRVKWDETNDETNETISREKTVRCVTFPVLGECKAQFGELLDKNFVF